MEQIKELPIGVPVNMLSFQMGDSVMMKIQRVTQFRKQCAVLKDEFVGHFHCMNMTKEQTWARQFELEKNRLTDNGIEIDRNRNCKWNKTKYVQKRILIYI